MQTRGTNKRLCVFQTNRLCGKQSAGRRCICVQQAHMELVCVGGGLRSKQSLRCSADVHSCRHWYACSGQLSTYADGLFASVIGGITIRTLKLRSKGHELDSQFSCYQVATTRMGDRLRTGKPSRYMINTKINLAFYPSGLGKLSTGLLVCRVTTCLENLEMSWNLKHVSEMSGMLLTVREMSGKKSCHGKIQ